MKRRLAPPRNVRSITPRCCATCRHLFIIGPDSFACERAPETIGFSIGDRKDIYTVCDHWAAWPKDKEQSWRPTPAA